MSRRNSRYSVPSTVTTGTWPSVIDRVNCGLLLLVELERPGVGVVALLAPAPEDAPWTRTNDRMYPVPVGWASVCRTIAPTRRHH